MYAFADDLVLVVQGIENLRASLTALENYCINHHLQINKSKSAIMIARKERITQYPPMFRNQRFEGYPIVT